MTNEAKARVLRELGQLSWKTKLIEAPDAVIYFDLPSSLPPAAKTEVLVLVPSGYPQAMIDYACLPQGSPLVGVVKGQPQHTISADGRNWIQISYHPHNGGGAPPWNPTQHGFHTYVDELLSWLAVR